MKKLALLGIAAAALAAAVPARAQISLTGECGLARTPNASVLAPMSLAVAADYVGSEDTLVPLRAGFGVIDGLEVAAHYWYVDTPALDNVFGLNLKYRLPLELPEGLGLALGGNYQVWSYDDDDFDRLQVLAVASYDLQLGGIPVTPSAGLIWEFDQQGDWDENGLRLFASVLATVMPNLGVGAEFISSNDDLDGEDADPSVWLGVRYSPLENFSVQAGVLNNLDVGDREDLSDYVLHFGAQYSYSFAR